MSAKIWIGKEEVLAEWGDKFGWVKQICNSYGTRLLHEPSWEKRGGASVSGHVELWNKAWGLEKLIDPVLTGAHFYLLEAVLSGAAYGHVGFCPPEKLQRQTGMHVTTGQLRAAMSDLLSESLDVLANYTDMIVGGELRHCGGIPAEGRRVSWAHWRNVRDVHKIDALMDAELHFVDHTAGSGYAGPPWATIAATLRWFKIGKLSGEMFIDRCMNLEHNGGNFLNKLSSEWKITNRFDWNYTSTKLVGDAHSTDQFWLLLALASDDLYQMIKEHMRAVNAAREWLKVPAGWGHNRWHPMPRAVIPGAPRHMVDDGFYEFKNMYFSEEIVIRDQEERDMIHGMKKVMGQPIITALSPISHSKPKAPVMPQIWNPWGIWPTQALLQTLQGWWPATKALSLYHKEFPNPPPQDDVTLSWKHSANAGFPLKDEDNMFLWNHGVTAYSGVIQWRGPPREDTEAQGSSWSDFYLFTDQDLRIAPTGKLKVNKGAGNGTWAVSPDVKWSIPASQWEHRTKLDQEILNNVALMTDRYWKEGGTKAGVTWTLVKWNKLPKKQRPQYENCPVEPDVSHIQGLQGHFKSTLHPEQVKDAYASTPLMIVAGHYPTLDDHQPDLTPEPVVKSSFKETVYEPGPPAKEEKKWLGVEPIVPIYRDEPVTVADVPLVDSEHTTQEIVDVIANTEDSLAIGLTVKEASEVIDAVYEVVADQLTQGQQGAFNFKSGKEYFEATLMKGAYTTGDGSVVLQGNQKSKEESDEAYGGINDD